MALSADQQRSMLADLLVLPGNKFCADCGEDNPLWASVNNSVLVCFQCAGIHRSLGADVSQVKSVKLDSWQVREIDSLSHGVTTQFVNETLLEYCVPADTPKPHPHSPRAARERYIFAKYAQRSFLPGKHKLRQPPISSTEHCPAVPASAHGPSSMHHHTETHTQMAGSVEFIGLLKVKMVSGRGVGLGSGVSVMSLPYVCVGLGGQVFKTKPGSDKENPTFQEDLLFSWDGKDCLNMEVMDTNSFVRDGTLGCCSVDVVSLGLPSGVPLFLEIPLIREPESEPTSGTIPRLSAGSLQIEVMVERLDH